MGGPGPHIPLTSHHVPQSTVPAIRPHRTVSAPLTRSPPRGNRTAGEDSTGRQGAAAEPLPDILRQAVRPHVPGRIARQLPRKHPDPEKPPLRARAPTEGQRRFQRHAVLEEGARSGLPRELAGRNQPQRCKDADRHRTTAGRTASYAMRRAGRPSFDHTIPQARLPMGRHPYRLFTSSGQSGPGSPDTAPRARQPSSRARAMASPRIAKPASCSGSQKPWRRAIWASIG